MPAATLALASVVLLLDPTSDVDRPAAVVDSIAGAIERRAGARVIRHEIDDCTPRVCVERAREATGVTEVVWLRVLRGLTRTRLVADRYAADRSAPASHAAEVPNADDAARSRALDDLALRLFPAPLGAAATSASASASASDLASASAPDESEPKPLFAIASAFGGAAAFLVAGTVAGAASERARSRLGSADTPVADLEPALADINRGAVAANVFFALGAAALVVGVWLLASE